MRAHINPLTKLSVRQQLILLFLILVSPVFILNGYGNQKAEGILKRHVTSAYVELNKQNQLLINRDMETVSKITTTIIQYPGIQQLIPSELETVFERAQKYSAMDKLLRSYSLGVNGGEAALYGLYIYDPNNLYFFAPKIRLYRNPGVYFFSDTDRPSWYNEAVARNGKGYLRIIDGFGPLLKEKTLAYIRSVNRITGGSGVIGVVVVTKMDKKLGESLQTVSLPDGGEIYLTDESNRILASAAGPIGAKLDLPALENRESVSNVPQSFITKDFIYVISDNHVLQHKLVYRIPVKSLLEQQSELKWVIQLISVVYFLFAFIVMMYFWRSLLTPLQKLARFAKSYEPGKLVPGTTRGERKDEVGVLISAIYDMAGRLNAMIHYKYHMELKQKESQLQLLYQQINPHLLYNTLESIYWRNSLEGNTESAEMIKDLSKLMKIGLSRGRELITIGEEVEHAISYVSLQQKRYDYTFTVTWNIAQEMTKYVIPKITLQPLIENAIIHGVKHMGEDGEIVISGKLNEDEESLQITVDDNGYKKVNLADIERLLYEEKADPALGYGIRNIHQRIQLHFGPAYGIRYVVREEGGVRVTIMLPLHDGQDSIDQPE